MYSKDHGGLGFVLPKNINRLTFPLQKFGSIKNVPYKYEILKISY